MVLFLLAVVGYIVFSVRMIDKAKQERAEKAAARERARDAAQAERGREEEKERKEAEKARKAEQARQLAQMQIDHFQILKDNYQEQAQALEEERTKATTSEARRAQINNKLLQLDEKIYKADLQIAKLFYKTNGGN